MTWPLAADAAASPATAAAATAAVEAAAELVGAAAARMPEVVAAAHWRSAAFDAFSARVDDWRADVEALARVLAAEPAAVPSPEHPFFPWRTP
jgi:uncharacterized protein YukE